MSTYSEVIGNIINRRQRAIDGKYNCLPLPFPRFKNFFPGIERSRYLLITANQKVGKSKFCDFMFIYDPLFFMMDHPELKIKVLYFTLEVTAKEKYNEFLCYLLYKLDNLIIDTKELLSTDMEHPLDPHIIELLNSDRYRLYREAYESMVIYIDDIKNPTGITKYCETYAEEHGHWTFKDGKRQDNFGNWVDSKVKDKYYQDDTEEYRVIILDNASNISLEKGITRKMDAIDKLSKYAIELRNKYGFIFTLIQHQAQSQEGNENIKLNRTYPTSDGLADCKTTSRDINISIGLFNPAKYGIKEWEHYDISKFGDHIRFMIVMDDRDYGAGGKICPLFFNGKSSVFSELPLPNDSESLSRVYDYIQRIDRPRNYLFFMKCNNFINNIAKTNIFRYLCSKFKR